MSEPLLKIRNLTVQVGEKEILHGLNLDVNSGETHVLMGPNGAGKSTLGNAIMGNPVYTVTGGEIIFDGKNILEESTDQRAKDGLFMSFQNPLEVPGISLSNFIRSSLEERTGKRVRLWDFRKSIKKEMQLLNMDESYADRDLNVGFSGGEKKKSEILQLLMLNPKLAILDETDSGLDVDAVRTVSKGVEEFQKTTDGALLIITHSTRILESLKVDYTHVLVDGQIIDTGDGSMVDEINENGFEKYIRQEKTEQ
ncbi:MAG: Fe-S cluster assembly ATPase SufC [Acutalibacteraceae bacterium]|nr:Fe-S cluster assembly ATPase SufC [Acutalibacteraceae bacterium]